ncbi:MAG: ATP-binding protein [Candidatus Zixiibacteriota bacterium]|nr:MAG: ATP-binding protein [candidate division Zixibacteria bacterium]
MSVSTKKTRVIMVPGELSEISLEEFHSHLEEVIAASPGCIDLDCSALNLVSSSHVNVLWVTREKCESAGVGMRLSRVSDCLIRILKLLDLFEFFDIDQAEQVETEAASTSPAPGPEKHRLQLRIKPVSEEILNVLGDFRQFLREMRTEPFCALELETVFYEILTNIRQHGKADRVVTVEVCVEADSEAIELTFTDNGPPFNPSENVRDFDAEHAVRTGQRHGFGLTMISRMTDSMDYERKNNELNVLKVKKYWE